jgi:hypothetical protein
LRILLSEAHVAKKMLLSVLVDQTRTHNAQPHHDTVAMVSSKQEDQDGSLAGIQPT